MQSLIDGISAPSICEFGCRFWKNVSGLLRFVSDDKLEKYCNVSCVRCKNDRNIIGERLFQRFHGEFCFHGKYCQFFFQCVRPYPKNPLYVILALSKWYLAGNIFGEVLRAELLKYNLCDGFVGGVVFKGVENLIHLGVWQHQIIFSDSRLGSCLWVSCYEFPDAQTLNYQENLNEGFFHLQLNFWTCGGASRNILHYLTWLWQLPKILKKINGVNIHDLRWKIIANLSPAISVIGRP